MKRWSVFVLLATVALVLLIAGELLKSSQTAGSENQSEVRLATRTPTVTRTPGWWEQVATWTPTPTGEATTTPQSTLAANATPTPELYIPPVKTLERPTQGGTP